MIRGGIVGGYYGDRSGSGGGDAGLTLSQVDQRIGSRFILDGENGLPAVDTETKALVYYKKAIGIRQGRVFVVRKRDIAHQDATGGTWSALPISNSGYAGAFYNLEPLNPSAYIGRFVYDTRTHEWYRCEGLGPFLTPDWIRVNITDTNILGANARMVGQFRSEQAAENAIRNFDDTLSYYAYFNGQINLLANTNFVESTQQHSEYDWVNVVESPDDGLFEGMYSATFRYAQGHITITADGDFHISKVDNNIGNDPTTDDGTNWLNLSEGGGSLGKTPIFVPPDNVSQTPHSSLTGVASTNTSRLYLTVPGLGDLSVGDSFLFFLPRTNMSAAGTINVLVNTTEDSESIGLRHSDGTNLMMSELNAGRLLLITYNGTHFLEVAEPVLPAGIDGAQLVMSVSVSSDGDDITLTVSDYTAYKAGGRFVFAYPNNLTNSGGMRFRVNRLDWLDLYRDDYTVFEAGDVRANQYIVVTLADLDEDAAVADISPKIFLMQSEVDDRIVNREESGKIFPAPTQIPFADGKWTIPAGYQRIRGTVTIARAQGASATSIGVTRNYNGVQSTLNVGLNVGTTAVLEINEIVDTTDDVTLFYSPGAAAGSVTHSALRIIQLAPRNSFPDRRGVTFGGSGNALTVPAQDRDIVHGTVLEGFAPAANTGPTTLKVGAEAAQNVRDNAHAEFTERTWTANSYIELVYYKSDSGNYWLLFG